MNETAADRGIVKEIEGKVVTVELVRGGSCQSCSLHGFCFPQNKPALFKLKSDLDLAIDDEVELMVAAEGRLLASFIIFGLPVIMLFLGYLLGSMFLSEPLSIALAFITMGFSFFIIKLCDKRWGKNIKVEILRKL